MIYIVFVIYYIVAMILFTDYYNRERQTTFKEIMILNTFYVFFLNPFTLFILSLYVDNNLSYILSIIISIFSAFVYLKVFSNCNRG